jgi:hypothetical protein
MAGLGLELVGQVKKWLELEVAWLGLHAPPWQLDPISFIYRPPRLLYRLWLLSILDPAPCFQPLLNFGKKSDVRITQCLLTFLFLQIDRWIILVLSYWLQLDGMKICSLRKHFSRGSLLLSFFWAPIEALVDVRVGELGVSLGLLRGLRLYCTLLDWQIHA